MSSLKKTIVAIISLFVLINPGLAKAQNATDWPMAAANPERTSHNAVEVRGNLNVDWYKVIDPFVDSKVQVIAVGGRLFLATSKGLYAFDANTGSQLWVYGTELPAGNSPTVVGNVVYLPGYDHRIRALNVADGKPVSGYSPYEAGAGFETNPVVINNTIYGGNRDGNVYALDATTGAKKWQFSTGGPVRFSPAFKNNVVYVVSDDSYAYAINASNGSQIWKSAKLPGAGFMTYWPVIWTDTFSGSSTNGQTFMLITASKKATTYNWWASDSNTDYQQENDELGSSCSSTGSQNYLWGANSTILDCSPFLTYFNSTRPDRRNLFILKTTDGTETTTHAPFNWAGASHGGNKYPPIIGGDGVIYTHVGYNKGGNGRAGGWISGWKFGSQYIKKIWDDKGAGDEPPAFTSGGNLIYWGEGVNHEAWGTLDTAGAVGSNYYSWQSPLNVTGSKSKYFFDSSGLWLTSRFGNLKNGVYSYYDGVSNQSPIPYNGRLYLVNGNVLFALKPSVGAGSQLGTASAPTTVNDQPIALTKNDVKAKLEREVQKIVNAGHLRPGQYTFGFATQHYGLNYLYNSGFNDNEVVAGDRLADYYHTPGETLATLSASLPYLSSALQTQLKNYLKSEQANYPVQTYAHIGWGTGAKRETYDDTLEITKVVNGGWPGEFPSAKQTQIRYLGCSNNCAEVKIGSFPPDAFYGAWKYAAAVLTKAEAKTLFDSMASKLQVSANTEMTNSNFELWPYILNQYIAGYRGYVELEKLAGYTSDISQSNKYSEYQRLVNLRVNTFSKDSPFSNFTAEEYHHNYIFNISRNFMFLTPELGDTLNINKKSAVQTAMDEYEILEPFWFVPKYERTYEEGVGHSLYDRWALFQAKAYILKEPFEELVKYLDEPAFEKGDLYYIQNLVATLASTGGGSTTLPSNKPGDTDGNGRVDIFDYNNLIGDFGGSNARSDFDHNGKVDLYDYNTVVANFGTQ